MTPATPRDIPQYLRRRHRIFEKYQWIPWSVVLLFLGFMFAFSAFASPIDKMVGVEGDAVRGNDYYCAHLAEYDADKEVIDYCNNL